MSDATVADVPAYLNTPAVSVFTASIVNTPAPGLYESVTYWKYVVSKLTSYVRAHTFEFPDNVAKTVTISPGFTALLSASSLTDGVVVEVTITSSATTGTLNITSVIITAMKTDKTFFIFYLSFQKNIYNRIKAHPLGFVNRFNNLFTLIIMHIMVNKQNPIRMFIFLIICQKCPSSHLVEHHKAHHQE